MVLHLKLYVGESRTEARRGGGRQPAFSAYGARPRLVTFNGTCDD